MRVASLLAHRESFSVTTNEVDNENLSEIALGVIGAELAWDAILNCVGA